MPDLLVDHALAHARRGFRVFPCQPNGKKPLIDGYPERATTDPEAIRAWWTRHPHANIGSLTGNGGMVADLDHKGGKNGTGAWLGMSGVFDTMMVMTPSGGAHLYFTTPQDVANSAGALGDGIDVRGHHGYVLAPGSRIDGKAYVLVQDVPPAPIPPHILARCTAPRERAANAHDTLVELDTPAALELANARVAEMSGAAHGRQSDAAYALACSLMDFGLSKHAAWNAMLPWAERCAPPIGPDDLMQRVENAEQHRQNAAGVKHPDVLFSGTKEAVAMIPAPTLLPPAAVAAERAERSGLRLLSAGDCASAPPRSYVVKNLLATGQLGCVFGAPGAGKSVLAPHVAYAVAQGRPVFGQRAKAAPVLYVAAEDEAGMQQRVTALRERHGDAPGFHLVVGVSSLLDPSSGDLVRLQHLVEELRPSLVVVDTLAAACPGLKENEADSMGSAVAALRSLTRNGAAVLAIHHSPKSGDTPRGHSVLNGALDVSIHVIADDAAEGVIQGQLHKNRNGACVLPDGNAIAFRIEAAPLGRDEDGDPVTAPVCAEMTREEARDARKANVTKTEAAAEAILVEMGGQAREVSMDDWAARCCEQGAVSKARRLEDRRVTFRKIRDRLRDKIRIRVGKAAGVETVMYLGHGAHETWGDRRAPPASLFPPGIVVPPSPPGGHGVPAQSVQVGVLQ